MSNEPQLHSSIIALVSLASGIAAKHPDMGLCQLEKLRGLGVPESQINTVIEIARHIRDEAAEKLDVAFNDKAAIVEQQSACCSGSQEDTKADESGCCESTRSVPEITKISVQESCCSSTANGQSCC